MSRNDEGASVGSQEGLYNHESANSYHNAASRLAKENKFGQASEKVKEGLRFYPGNIDLLADGVKFCDIATRTECFESLNRIGYNYWNWRAFTFCIDCLVEQISDADKSDPAISKQLDVLRDKALTLADEFVRLWPCDERAYKARADVLKTKGSTGRNKAMDYYESIFFSTGGEQGGLPSYPMAQCCVDYADMLSEDGEYENVINVCRIGIAGTAQEQPSASTAYLYYVKALAEDALIHRDTVGALEEEVFDRRKILASTALKDYSIAYRLFMLDGLNAYNTTILSRSVILSTKTGLDNPLQEQYEQRGSSIEGNGIPPRLWEILAGAANRQQQEDDD